MAIVKKQSSSKQIIEYILDRVQKRELKSGDKLPNEREFSEMLGVSRVPLREAISALSLLGILDARQGEGTFVNKYDSAILGKVIYTYTILDNTSMDEILEVRKMMEADAAKLASENASEEDLREIRVAMEQRDKELELYKRFDGNGELVYEHDSHFHHAIAEATHNRFCVQFLDAIRQSAREQHQSGFNKHDLSAYETASDFHHRIYDAISSGNAAEAYEVMYKHIESVQEATRRLNVKGS
ncbi:MAG: FadR/GntR family transcriptional regulator [Treponemataceae bacterium]